MAAGAVRRTEATSHQLRRRRGTRAISRRKRRRHSLFLSSEAIGGLIVAAIFLILFFLFVLLPTGHRPLSHDARDGAGTRSAHASGLTTSTTANVYLGKKRLGDNNLHNRKKGRGHGSRRRDRKRDDAPASPLAFDYDMKEDVDHHQHHRPRHGRQHQPNSQKKGLEKNGSKEHNTDEGIDRNERHKHLGHDRQRRPDAAAAAADAVKEHGANAKMPKKHRRTHNNDVPVPDMVKAAQRRRKITQHDAEMTKRYTTMTKTTNNNMNTANNNHMRHLKKQTKANEIVDVPTSNHLFLGDAFPDDKLTKGGTYATIPLSLDTATESPAIGIGLWVNLSSNGRMSGSKTIFATMPSRCGIPANKQISGLRLYVNSEGTADEELVLEYTARNDFTDDIECVVLKSLGSQVPVATWTHIGVGIDSLGAVTMHINGGIVSESDYGREHNTASGNVMEGGTTWIGQGLEGGEDVLDGTIGFLVIWARNGKENNNASSSSSSSWKDVMSKMYSIGLDEDKIRSDTRPAYMYPFDSSSIPTVLETMHGLDGSISLRGREALRDDARNASQKQFKPLGGGRYDEYRDGRVKTREVKQEMREESDAKARERREIVRDAIKHAWNGYETHAFGWDELLPISEHGRNNWGGIGMTLIDSLDTLWLAGMKEEFARARDWVRDHLSFDSVGDVSVFEVTIRCLGGLLSAFDLSGDRAFLEKAADLGSRLFKAFDSPSELPYDRVALKTGKIANPRVTDGRSRALLAEVATLQLEFRHLSRITGKKEYAEKSERVYEMLASLAPDDGLYPLHIKIDEHGKLALGLHISFGALGDSAYEYFLKTWLQGGKKEGHYRELYDRAIQGLHDKLLERSIYDDLLYVAEMSGGRLTPKMDHLACFLPGLLALGAHTNPSGIESELAQRDMKSARAMAYTCYQMYARTATGLSPEYVEFSSDSVEGDIEVGDSHYLLRPETVETMYILHHLTGDPTYREWGWEIFEAIEAHCKTDAGYGYIVDVDNVDGLPQDEMESFFLAETLKYLYLLFDPDSSLDILEKVVFNTEAHPLRVFPALEREASAATL